MGGITADRKEMTAHTATDLAHFNFISCHLIT